MKCRSAREWTLTRLDAPLAAAAERELQAHLTHCAACAEHARDAATLQKWTASMPLAQPSENFDWRLRLRLSKAEREALEWPLSAASHSRRASFEFASAAAIAASIVLAGGTWLLQRSAPPAAETGSVVWNLPTAERDASGGRTIPLSDGAPYGPQPAPSYSYFIQSAAPVADTTGTSHSGTDADR